MQCSYYDSIYCFVFTFSNKEFFCYWFLANLVLFYLITEDSLGQYYMGCALWGLLLGQSSNVYAKEIQRG